MICLPGSTHLGVVASTLDRMSEPLARAAGVLCPGEAEAADFVQRIARMPKVAQHMMDLQEVAAMAGAQYVLTRLCVCRPEWSIHDLVTTEPQARLA